MNWSIVNYLENEDFRDWLNARVGEDFELLLDYLGLYVGTAKGNGEVNTESFGERYYFEIRSLYQERGNRA